jgi:hypothetical protein
LLASGLLLFGATSASAFAVSMVARGGVTSLTTSQTVTVDVFLDVTAGMTILSIGVLNSSTAALLYDGPASAALALHPQIGSNPLAGCYFGNCSGAQPSYILYTGRGSPAMSPLNVPYFVNFPAPPGTEQVNVSYVEDSFGTTTAITNGLYIATLVFHVVGINASETIQLAITSSNIIQAGTFVVPPTSITLSAPIGVTTVPEPTTAVLIGLGVLGLGLAGRRRA